MSMLTLEPRDAGALALEDLSVEFEDMAAVSQHEGERCNATCFQLVTTHRCVATF